MRAHHHALSTGGSRAGPTTSRAATATSISGWTTGYGCGCAVCSASGTGGKGRGRGQDHNRYPNAYWAELGLISLKALAQAKLASPA